MTRRPLARPARSRVRARRPRAEAPTASLSQIVRVRPEPRGAASSSISPAAAAAATTAVVQRSESIRDLGPQNTEVPERPLGPRHPTEEAEAPLIHVILDVQTHGPHSPFQDGRGVGPRGSETGDHGKRKTPKQDGTERRGEPGGQGRSGDKRGGPL